jgi:3-hydroxybutyryl-CoA dehydrogenase
MEFEEIKVVSIFGAGRMGHGIAQVMALEDYKVIIVDVSQEFLDAGLKALKKSLQKAVEKEIIDNKRSQKALSLVSITTSIDEAGGAADFIIEAIPEKIELKKELFRKLNDVCKREAIIASNTSTFSITDMASSVRNPERFVGMHYFNPVPQMKLVEVIKGLTTSDHTMELAKKMVLKLGKEPVIVKDSPGFIANRLGIALFLEASRVLEEGVASIEDIDKTMRLGWGNRMGPFETIDLVGLDARLNNFNSLYQSTGNAFWQPPELLKKLVSAGYLGKKIGSKGGYYTYFGFE